MNLDYTDQKLLTYLYHHNRESLKEIGKKCNLTKDQITYRMNKYEQEGIIIKYITLYDYNLFGYHNLVGVWLSCKDKETIRNDLETMKNILTYGDFLSKWDICINFLHKNLTEFENQFNEFLLKHKDNIIHYSTFIMTQAEFFDLKTFGVQKQFQSFKIISPKNHITLSKNDLKILKLLKNNGRMKIIDIAKKTNLSSTAIMKNIKKYKKTGIIQGTRLLLDMEKLGYFWGEIHIKLKKSDKKTISKFMKFGKNHKHINMITFGIGEISCIIQVFYKNENNLRQTIRDMKELFKDEIIEYNIMFAENEGLVKTLPFID